MRNKFALYCVVVLGCLLAAIGVASAAGKAKQTHGTAWVGVTHVDGDYLVVAGDFKDSKLGKGAIIYLVKPEAADAGGILVKAKKITLYTRKGSLQGKGQAIETLNPDGTGDVTDGKFSLKKGTGAYKGHTFKGTFGGTYADGIYTFDYDAVFK